MTITHDPILYSIKTTAQKLNVHPNTISRWISANQIPSVKIGDTRRIPARWVESLAEAGAGTE